MVLERLTAAAAGMVLLALGWRAARSALRERGVVVDVLALYLLLWGTVLLLFSVPLIRYTPTPLVAWVCIYGSVLSGALACLAVRWRCGVTAAEPRVAAARLQSCVSAPRLRLMWAVSALIGMAGLGVFVYAVSRVLPWHAVLTDPQAVRLVKRDSAVFQETYGIAKLLTYFNFTAGALWVAGLRVGAFTGRWAPVRLVGVGSMLPFFLTADRGLLVALVTWTGLLLLVWPRRVPTRRTIATAFTCALLVGIAVTAIGNRYGGSLGSNPEVSAELNTRLADPVVIPYLYLTANLPTFGQLTQDELAPPTYGQMSILPLAKAAHATVAPGAVPVQTGVFYPIPFEVFSNYGWLGTFWLDFRLAGVLLLPALVMGLAAWLQTRVARAPTIAGLWLLSLVLYAIAFSPFANALSTAFTWQMLLLTPVMALVLDKGVFASAMARVQATRKSVRVALAATAAATVAAAAVSVSNGSLRSITTPAGSSIALDADVELATAMAKVVPLHGQYGRFPSSLGLATRLQVNRPDIAFRPQQSVTEEPPEPGVIAVFTSPDEAFLRTRAADGRVFEVHRSERLGGLTFGPGTRDD